MNRGAPSATVSRVGWLVVLLVLGAGALVERPRADAQAQPRAAAAGGVETLPIRPNVYMLAGAGANVVAHVGWMGVVLVDTGSANMSDEVLAAIQRITDQKIRFIINTTADADHVGGNAALARAGRTLLRYNVTNGGGFAGNDFQTNRGAAGIMAQENVLTRMSATSGDKPAFPGDEWVEKRIRRIIRWNAMAMVARANRDFLGIGGHLSTYASTATLYEVGFNHFFRGRDEASPGDQVYFQGHAAPGIYAGFGFEGDRVGPWKKRLGSRSHVVIGLIDTGVNPYHIAYRRPEYTIHPSLYIEGFPTDAPALGLDFNGSDYVAARTGDDAAVWSQVGERTLYWIPGTNIIGAYSIRNESGTPPAGVVQRPIIDDNGHGTGTSSVAGGAGFSYATRAPLGSNPEVLLVIIEGLGHEAVEWALNQPWIDIISGSYGNPLAIPYDDLIDGFAQEVPVVQEELGQYEYRFTAPFVLRDGRTACFSAGNGLSRTGIAYDRYSSIRPTSGPSWVVTVGAISPRNEQDYGWHSVPVDISSYGNHWPAAAPFSLDGEQEFGGTSNATPVAAGVFSRALLAVRRALGDAVEGIHVDPSSQSVPALGPANVAGGLASDGVLTRGELQEAVFKTARPGQIDPENFLFDPLVIPDSPAYFTMQGYGLANVASAGRAIDVLLGKTPMPQRPEVDAWIAAIDLIRDSVWPPPTYSSEASPTRLRPGNESERAIGFGLEQNGPNPFRDATTIRFRIPEATRVRCEVLDVSGRLVNVLAEGDHAAGVHAVGWDRRDAAGSAVRPGVYFYRLTAGPWRAWKKMVVLP